MINNLKIIINDLENELVGILFDTKIKLRYLSMQTKLNIAKIESKLIGVNNEKD